MTRYHIVGVEVIGVSKGGNCIKTSLPAEYSHETNKLLVRLLEANQGSVRVIEAMNVEKCFSLTSGGKRVSFDVTFPDSRAFRFKLLSDTPCIEVK